MEKIILNLYSFATGESELKITLMLFLILTTALGSAQNFSNDTCVLLSQSRLVNYGMDEIYTDANGPVKSILIDNRKWIFDSTGKITEELMFNPKDIGQVDRRKIIEYYQTGQVKSVSLYEKSEQDQNMPNTIIDQELYSWNKDTLIFVQLKGVDTIRSVLEVIHENGCVKFSRQEYGRYITETAYEYNSFGLQTAKRFEQRTDNILVKNFEEKLFYKNNILASKISVDLISGKTVYRHYHLVDDELKGYLMTSPDLSDSTHTVSYNEAGEIIFRQYDDRAFYLVESSKDGIRYKDKVFSYDDGTRKIDRFEFFSNGNVIITSIENDEQQSRTTKEQIKDERGNWIELVTVREQLNKPNRAITILREIEYFE